MNKLIYGFINDINCSKIPKNKIFSFLIFFIDNYKNKLIKGYFTDYLI